MISVGLRLNKCMHTEGLGKAGSAQHGLGWMLYGAMLPIPRAALLFLTFPAAALTHSCSLLCSTFQGILLQNAPSNGLLAILIH